MQVLTRYAWAFGLAGFLALVSGVSLGWAFGSFDGRPTQILVVAAVLLLSYAGLDRDRVEGTVTSRVFVHSGSSALLTALVFAAAVATYALAEKNDKTWDLTRKRSFTLSEQTVGLLQGLDEDVQVLAFFRNDGQEQRDFRGLIERMEEHTERLKVEWIDPLRQPRLAEEHDISSEQGTVILITSDDRKQRLDAERSEEVVMQRLVLLLSRVEHRVCWALGHGEPDPDDEHSERGLGVGVIELEELNYQVMRQMIPTNGIDPACDALVIARPTLEWATWEREALAAYMAGGGRALLMLEPDGSPGLAEEMERYGFNLRADVVLDLNPENQMMGVDDPAFVVLHGRNLLSHPITASLAAAVVLPIARSIEAIEREGVVSQPVLQTSEDAWGETGTDGTQMPQPDPLDELVGEVPVMGVAVIDDPAALEVVLPEEGPVELDPSDPDAGAGRGVPDGFTPEPGGRLVLIGDADFAANGYIGLGNNRDLFLNSIAWLVEEEDQIGERPEASESLAIDDLAGAAICLISVIFVPGGVGLLALLSWFRRRRL